MSDSFTISTHNGSAVCREHNVRNRKYTDKQEHIDPNGHFEIWEDEKQKKAYNRIFGEALEEYNSKQPPYRKIEDYFSAVKKDKKKHTVYELIVSVGSVERAPTETISKQILSEFYRRWGERNPNLELIGAYYHADEQGVPHLHLDYIPVASGYKRGLKIQNGLDKALRQQGFGSSSSKHTAQIEWERRENDTLEAICQSFGLNIIHPERIKPKNERKKHLHTVDYAVEASKKAVEAQEEVSLLLNTKKSLESDIEAFKAFLEGAKPKLAEEYSTTMSGFGKKRKQYSLVPTDELREIVSLANCVRASKSAIETLENSSFSKILNQLQQEKSELSSQNTELQKTNKRATEVIKHNSNFMHFVYQNHPNVFNDFIDYAEKRKNQQAFEELQKQASQATARDSFEIDF